MNILNKLKKKLVLIYFFIYKLLLKSSKNSTFHFVIFSKDRTLQLDSLLKSMFFFISGEYKITVIYNTSSLKYQNAYNQLINDYLNNENVKFVNETSSFKSTLEECFLSIKQNKIFFLVDDIIFKKHLNLNSLKEIDTSKYIFSLRHGLHLNFSYVVNKEQQLPKDILKKNKFYSWIWRNAQLDWAYPLSVDGHLFDCDEVRFWIKYLDYKAPNTFEAELQNLLPYYHSHIGLCFKESIIFNNPCNKVQTEINNFHGKFHQDDLLHYWELGKRIDFLAVENYKNNSVHEEFVYSII